MIEFAALFALAFAALLLGYALFGYLSRAVARVQLESDIALIRSGRTEGRNMVGAFDRIGQR